MKFSLVLFGSEALRTPFCNQTKKVVGGVFMQQPMKQLVGQRSTYRALHYRNQDQSPKSLNAVSLMSLVLKVLIQLSRHRHLARFLLFMKTSVKKFSLIAPWQDIYSFHTYLRVSPVESHQLCY